MEPSDEPVTIAYRFPLPQVFDQEDLDPARTYVSGEDPEAFWHELLRWQR